MDELADLTHASWGRNKPPEQFAFLLPQQTLYVPHGWLVIPTTETEKPKNFASLAIVPWTKQTLKANFGALPTDIDCRDMVLTWLTGLCRNNPELPPWKSVKDVVESWSQ